jgi:tripartite-type tricarboxylate transporter receptor subunit TctC
MAARQALFPRGTPGAIPCLSRSGTQAAILLALWLVFSPPAFAASTLARGYPTLPVSLAVPFAENDQGNAFLELFLPALRGATLQPVTLRRVPGRGGGYALREILGKPADGHSLALLTLPSFFLQAVPPNRLYTREEIAPMVFLAHIPTALWVEEGSPLATLGDLAARARSREVSASSGVPDSEARSPEPPLAIAGAGSYTDVQVASLLLARAVGIRIQYLPFLSTAKAAEAVRQGLAVACFGYACATPPMPGLRPLAVAAETRVPALPGTPTFREAGMEIIVGQDIGLAMPAGADPEDVALIADFFLRLQESAGLGAALSREGFFPLRFPHAETAAFLRRREEGVNSFLREYPLFPVR